MSKDTLNLVYGTLIIILTILFVIYLFSGKAFA